MTEVYFHCSNAEQIVIDRCGAAMDITEARERADGMVRWLVMSPSSEDWRDWVLHATDDLGEEIFSVPFASIVGKLH